MGWWRQASEDDEAALRARLLKARARVAEQLEIMKAGPASRSYGWSLRYKEQAAHLTQTLAEIDESLAGLSAGTIRGRPSRA
jgi:hypothetical protein